MTAAQCRDQARCPVGDPGALRSVRTLSIDAGEIWHNVGSVEHDDIFNSSGKGNGRFSPLRSGGNGEPLPHLYLARYPIGALLETVLHGFTAANREVVAGRDLVGRTLRSVELPERLLVADLRDQELERLGIDRRSLVSSSSEHYRCTQEWAYRIRSLKPGGRSLAGIVWNSRVAEIVSTVAAPTTRPNRCRC
ncbi:MAG: RES family NAD+ phosphorylase [Acidimicrobiales bacterium]